MTELIAINPATLEEIGRVPVSTAEEIHQVVEEAHAAAADPAWRDDTARRRGLMAACSVKLMEHQQELAELLCAEVGKPVQEAVWEVWVTAKAFAEIARTDWEDVEHRTDFAGRDIEVRREPYGVVAAIVPWNFPTFLAGAKVAPALAAGNAVVVKPAETIAIVMARVVELLNEVLPAGLLHIVQGGPEVGAALIDERRVRKVSFTGSTAVGRKIMEQAAQTLTPVTLELGGNDPVVVLADVDIEYTAGVVAQKAFYNAGQMCIAPKRAYVPRDLVDQFCDAFARAMSAHKVGDGREQDVTVGPLHNQAQRDYCRKVLDDAVAAGGRIVVGGEAGTDLPGWFLEPTLVRDVDDSVELVHSEQFGTVFPVVAYDDLDEVLAILDSQEHGLGASVWSRDEERAVEVADRIDAGSVWINHHNALEVNLPFGGMKSSGFGREGGIHGIDDFSQWKVVDTKHVS